MTSEMIPYGRQDVDAADLAAVTAVLSSDFLTTGPAVEEFERRLAETVGSPLGAVAVTSGTAALHVAYAALGVTRGVQVITSPLTFVATASAAVLLGADVVFADVDAATGNLDPAAAAAAVTASTRVITGVDYAGVPIDADRLMSVAHEAGAHLVEDAAHSIGSSRGGRPVGSLADVTTFSFFPTKNVTTAEGGAVAATDAEILRRAREFRSHGMVRDRHRQRYPDEGAWHQEVQSFGLNYRMPDVLAALGVSQLSRIDAFKQRRGLVFDRYTEGLRDVDGIILPHAPNDTDPMWHLYPLRVQADERRRIFDHLRAEGIGVQVNYIPVYWHPVFEDLGYRRGMCPVAEDWYRSEISLPMHATLSPADMDRTIEAVRRAVGA